MKTLFNDDWKFCKVPLETTMKEILDASAWTPVDLPHDWLIYDTQNLYEDSIGCYQKVFQVDELGKDSLFIRFEGVYMDTTIYVNRKEVFTWKYGYSTFEVDLTDYLVQGENEILVQSVYRSPNSRWYSGAGIYRNVWLIRKPETYFVSDGSYISTVKEEKNWKVLVDIEAVSKLSGADSYEKAVIRHTIKNMDGELITSKEALEEITNEVKVNHQEIEIESPILWDIENPYLYEITSELLVNDTVKDSVTQKLGFKTFYIDPDHGFFLNERPIKIQGSCEHHDLGALGAAMNKVALRREFAMLKEMGVNSVRSAHNMSGVEFMDLADEMGLLVYTEAFDMWERTKTDYDYGNYFNEWWKKDITSWVRRDRNHPSLIFWGIGNEIYDTHFEHGLEITKMLRDGVRELDPRKNGLIAIGSNFIEWENAQKCSDEVDVSGYNYMEHLYDEHHKKYPHWCIFGSETASTVQSRGIYHFPLTNRLLTHDDMQCSCLGNCTTNWGAKNVDTVIANHRDREFCFGQYIWTGWDYIGEPTPYFSKNSFFGQIDTAGFKKDTFYHYQAEWTDYKKAPMVHILPYWDFNEGQLIDVCVYSNAPEVELFLNGESLGKQSIEHEHGTTLQGIWQIPYTKGTLVAKAYDEAGTIVATDTQSSFTDAVELVAKPDKYKLKADGEDLIFLEISAIDEKTHFVANARNRVEVKVTGAGRLVGLDNGDSTDYDQYKGTSRRLFSGKLLAIIASKQEPGMIHVELTSKGLKPASVDLVAVRAEKIEGLTATMENKKSMEVEEIPVRKIELTNLGSHRLNEDTPTTEVVAAIYPEDATYSDITFRAMTLDGIESNCVKVEREGKKALIKARGDGEFRLCCSANNGAKHPEVISELEFTVEGLGKATLDPYGMVSGCQYSSTSCKVGLSFLGGVYITSNERTRITFENVDFGDYGSDEVSIPIFSFEDTVPVEVWIGEVEKDFHCILKDTYYAKSWYNHYQANTYQLPERIKGIQTISIILEPKVKMSLQGFSFTKREKAYATLLATDNNRITGDAFTVEEDAITDIGNNVTIEYEGMDFGETGFTKLVMCGRSHIESNTIHVRFMNETDSVNQIVEFPFSEEYVEKTFELNSVKGCHRLNLIFLPGSKFDLKWFRFEK